MGKPDVPAYGIRTVRFSSPNKAKVLLVVVLRKVLCSATTRHKQGSGERHVDTAKAGKAEPVSTSESKPRHSSVPLHPGPSQAVQLAIVVSMQHYCP